MGKEKLKVLSVFGTRPEAIKMCPLVKELEKHEEIESLVCLTGQHKEMLQQVIDIFQIKVDYDLKIMKPKQTLTSITSDVLLKIKDVYTEVQPDIVLVHGDTTTSFAAALAAFYEQIPVGHVEAGLRTYDPYSPFPEEMNRTLTSRLATYHFCPTELNASNLKKEGVTKNVFVTGNTVIDALDYTVREGYEFKNPVLQNVPKWKADGKRIILVTAHRRENLGKPLENICKAIRELHDQFDDLVFVYPVHLNPVVQETAHRILDGLDRVHLLEPIDVEDMHNLMSQSYLVMTDSGGLQEEAPAFGVPVLVLRTETERPESLEYNVNQLVGIETEFIKQALGDYLLDPSKYTKDSINKPNPFGDGKASSRINKIILCSRR